MIDITKHIQELLFQHDCVILPGFGGFILQRRDARYDASSKMFLPPARELSFNGLLTTDDGLLISRIVEREGIGYEKGREIVSEYITLLRSKAKNGQGAAIDGVGKFMLSGEGKWVFTPSGEINYLESAFGFRPVTARPVTPASGRTHQRPLKERVDRKPAARTKPVPTPVKWTLATGIPIILFLLWGIIFPGSFQRQYTSYSGFLSDFLHTVSVQPSNPIASGTSHEPATRRSNAELEYAFTAMPGIKIFSIGITHPQPQKLTLRESSNVQTIMPPGTYHVIGGVFMSEENASRYIDALCELGYNAALAGNNRQGHFRVSYDSFRTWKEAASFLKDIQRKENPSAWILKY